jgi:flagellar secretion chaperone FliS
MAPTASQQYAREYMRTQTETSSPTKLVVMLYDGAVRFLSLARDKMASGDLEARHTYLVKAQRILGELLSALDFEKGGEVAKNLQRIYTYMLQQLVDANLNDRVEPIDEVIRLLRDLRESWAEVDKAMQAAHAQESPVAG